MKSFRWDVPGDTYKAPANEYEKMVVNCFLALTARGMDNTILEQRFQDAVNMADRVFDQIAAYRNYTKKGSI